MAQRGGKRPGAGRKPGASFAQMVSIAEKKKFVEFILDQYMGDMRLALWMGDQLFGKAPASLDVTSDGDKIEFVTTLYGKPTTNSDGKDLPDVPSAQA